MGPTNSVGECYSPPQLVSTCNLSTSIHARL